MEYYTKAEIGHMLDSQFAIELEYSRAEALLSLVRVYLRFGLIDYDTCGKMLFLLEDQAP